MVLKSFKEHDGLELLDKLLEHCWRRLADTGGEPKRTGGDQEQSGKSRDINLHCVHAILDIFAWMTTSRYIIDVPQSLELSGRTSDRKNPDFFRPAVFLVELRIAILPVATRLWRLEYTSKTPSSVVKRLLKVLRIAMDGDSEGGAFAPQSYRISSKSAPDMDFEPNAQLLEQMNDEGQSEELNREALIRCYNVYDHAREYVEAQASSSRFRRYPVARRLVHDSQGTGVSTNQYAQQHPELPMDPAMPNLSADGNQSSLSRNVLETPEQPLVQPSQVNGLANSESMLGLDLGELGATSH